GAQWSHVSLSLLSVVIRNYFLPCQWRMDCDTPLNFAILSQIGMGKAVRNKPTPLAYGGSITRAFFCWMPFTIEATTFSGLSMGVKSGFLTPSNMPVSM